MGKYADAEPEGLSKEVNKSLRRRNAVPLLLSSRVPEIRTAIQRIWREFCEDMGLIEAELHDDPLQPNFGCSLVATGRGTKGPVRVRYVIQLTDEMRILVDKPKNFLNQITIIAEEVLAQEIANGSQFPVELRSWESDPIPGTEFEHLGQKYRKGGPSYWKTVFWADPQPNQLDVEPTDEECALSPGSGFAELPSTT